CNGCDPSLSALAFPPGAAALRRYQGSGNESTRFCTREKGTEPALQSEQELDFCLHLEHRRVRLGSKSGWEPV
uniref:Uncharacterized protein n=1 Tax=Chelonoidis abingdonii TaxID=106734 RepID=A0A8C0GRJ4_CHEAB